MRRKRRKESTSSNTMAENPSPTQEIADDDGSVLKSGPIAAPFLLQPSLLPRSSSRRGSPFDPLLKWQCQRTKMRTKLNLTGLPALSLCIRSPASSSQFWLDRKRLHPPRKRLLIRRTIPSNSLLIMNDRNSVPRSLWLQT